MAKDKFEVRPIDYFAIPELGVEPEGPWVIEASTPGEAAEWAVRAHMVDAGWFRRGRPVVGPAKWRPEPDESEWECRYEVLVIAMDGVRIMDWTTIYVIVRDLAYLPPVGRRTVRKTQEERHEV